MNLPKWSWITAKLLIFLLVPTLLYVWIGQSIFNNHLKTVVTNDPDAGLNRSISALQLALDEEYQILLSQINHTTDKDWILKNLSDPDMTPAQYHQMGSDLAGYLQRPLFILADKNGNILFDTIDLSKAETLTSSTPALAPNNVTPQTVPFSVKDWPGFAEAFEKNVEMGLTAYGNQYYLSVCAPIISNKKIIGAIALGMKLDGDVMERIKSITQNNVVFYADNRVQISTFPGSFASEVNKAAFAPRHSDVSVNDQKFLWDDVPINDLDQVVAGHFFIFQPILETITVEGSTLKHMTQLAIIFVLAMLALGLWYNLNLLSPLRQIIEQTNLVKKGQWNTPLPVKRHDDWGKLARSIREMILNLKDKERITLILGKVVSPQTTQKLLAENNYFSLKGERREGTLLQAQIKEFETVSQSMAPEVLVEVLNDYFSLINQIVFDQEGMIDKFIGDRAIAVWGAPIAHEDKEIRAVRAALEIQKAVQELNVKRIDNGQVVFDLGIGIHTGWVVCGNLGSDRYYDYSVIGGPLQIVDNICAAAAPNQIIVSEETYEKIETLVQVTPANPIMTSGDSEPLKTYEINKFL
jgi:class 3 adenylate cyclase/HAMP domain-containing protein